MAKSIRARSSRPNNGQRSPNVCVSSSCPSSSSDDNDFADDNCIGNSMSSLNNRGANRSWGSKKSRTSSSETSFNGSGKTTNCSADAIVEGGPHRPRGNRPGQDRATVLSKRSNSGTSKRKWEDDDEDLNSSRKGPKCFSRNAVMARLNRIKKKHHLESLENNVSQLSEENKTLKSTLKNQTETVRSLKNRVRYLESVLANSREISMLLKNIEFNTGLPTINSLQTVSNLASFKEQSKGESNGFPPPQLDHMYSKTPDVSACGVPEEETLCVPNTVAPEEAFQTAFVGDDTVTLPYMPSDDNLLDMNLLSPNSDDMFIEDFADYNQHFEDDDKLLSDVGICLHIAKKRVSLEFCATCNNNAVNAWDHSSIFV